jgi:hypothetical protein
MVVRRGGYRRLEPDVLIAVGRCLREIPGGCYCGPACWLLDARRLWAVEAVAVAWLSRFIWPLRPQP